jgi:hypothetical protein
MRDGGREGGRWLAVLVMAATLGLTPGRTAAAAVKVQPLAVGWSFEYLSRTVFWGSDTSASKIGAGLLTARADLGLGRGAVVSFSAGLALAGFRTLSFGGLPVTLELGSPTLSSFSLGAEAVVPVHRFSDFEISGSGRVVYSYSASKTWALEGFAVEGKAVGESTWAEVAAGPRLTYLAFGRIVPYLEIWARWLHAGFDMTETLADLTGSQSRRVRGDWSLSVALGADADVTKHIALRAKAGFLPRAGGIDGTATIGILYKF